MSSSEKCSEEIDGTPLNLIAEANSSVAVTFISGGRESWFKAPTAVFRKTRTRKRRALVSVTAVFLCASLSLLHTPYTLFNTIPHVRQENMRYILQWNDARLAPLNFMGHGPSAYTSNGCEYTNCYVTSDRDYFADVSEFDAIVFNGRSIEQLAKKDLPLTRSARQKYVFSNMESSHNYPVCSSYYEDYFNWTWTYKLNSDSRWGYFTVFNSTNGVVAPKVDMRWPEYREAVDNGTKKSLDSKSRAAAWFVSNCDTLSRRNIFAGWVGRKLRDYGLSLHVYGKCGKFTCERSNSEACLKMLAKHYYFYFAFENSFAEDYVTEKVLIALNNYAIPVVYGGANYSRCRFLPPGSYLDAMKLGTVGLATRMASIIRSHRSNDPKEYYDFFRWRNHYAFRLTFEKEDICNQCRMLNDPALMSKKTVYQNFKAWWNKAHGNCG